MKKVLLSIILLLTGLGLFAQHTANDFLYGENMVWYGLDFSQAKFVGFFDQGYGIAPSTGSDIKYRYIPSWNMLVLNEPSKYDLRKYFRKGNVYHDLSMVDKNNSKIDVDNLMTYNDYNFDNADKTITNIVNNYSAGDKKEGIGCVFIIEYFNKRQRRASIYVTIFDIKTKAILIKEHLYGAAAGFGLRNYWGRTIYNSLKSIDRTFYKQWKFNSK